MTQIRNAQKAEVERLSQIAKAAKAHWGYPQAWLQSWDQELTILPEYLNKALVRVLLDDQDQLQGFFAASQTDGIWELDHAWVHPAGIGKGYGRMLFADMLEQLQQQGVSAFDILSDPYAEPFYQKMGAVKIEDRPSNQAGRTLPLYRYTL